MNTSVWCSNVLSCSWCIYSGYSYHQIRLTTLAQVPGTTARGPPSPPPQSYQDEEGRRVGGRDGPRLLRRPRVQLPERGERVGLLDALDDPVVPSRSGARRP